MNFWVVIAIVAGAVVVAGLLALAAFIVHCARGAEKRFQALLKGESLLFRANGANFSGRTSQKARMRGNGILALTPTRLFFVMWAPRVTLELPLSNVSGARVESSFLGRTGPALVVDFEDRAGTRDSCGWVTAQAEALAPRIVGMAGKRR
ncbi:MAG: hypothetical protein AAB074_13980 [Planctomycetota bacterium]